jgi:hypothetical protein
VVVAAALTLAVADTNNHTRLNVDVAVRFRRIYNKRFIFGLRQKGPDEALAFLMKRLFFLRAASSKCAG